MNILFLGDIVGRAGRDIVFKHLKQLQNDYEIDFTIVNGENSAHGKGITTKIYSQFKTMGIDAITLGNHAYAKGEIKEYIASLNDLIAPYNHLVQIDKGYQVYMVNGLKLCVCNLLGSALMYENNQDAFSALEDIINITKADLYIVDFHAEATSEKMLLAQYFKNRVSAVIGTHTHVQTADERLIEGTAYISDAGMCGVYDSIIGRDIEEMVNNIIKKEKTTYTIAKGPAILCGCVISIDEHTKKATDIKRIQIRP